MLLRMVSRQKQAPAKKPFEAYLRNNPFRKENSRVLGYLCTLKTQRKVLSRLMGLTEENSMPILPDSFVRSFLKYQKCSPLKIN
jgi:hypothetical protein